MRVSEDLLGIAEIATGKLPQVFAISTLDITPYGNGLYHLNSIMQPCTCTDAPVVGVAITTQTAVPGCASGRHAPARSRRGRHLHDRNGEGVHCRRRKLL